MVILNATVLIALIIGFSCLMCVACVCCYRIGDRNRGLEIIREVRMAQLRSEADKLPPEEREIREAGILGHAQAPFNPMSAKPPGGLELNRIKSFFRNADPKLSGANEAPRANEFAQPNTAFSSPRV